MMVYESRNIKVEKTARFWLGGDVSGKAHTVHILLHGYAMSAYDCLEHFKGLEGPGVLLVSPEGLSRFYRKGFAGDVVASWMTREERLHEISDQAGYLNKLLDQIRSETAPEARVVNVFGYSQGSATGARWIAFRHGHGIDTFVIWAGDFPQDVIEGGWPAGIKIIQVYSESDEFIPSAKFHEQAAKLQQNGAIVQQFPYEGRHAVLPETVQRIKYIL